MKKKMILAAILAATLLCGCGSITHSDVKRRFIYVSRDYNCDIVYDRYTGVMYSVSSCAYNNGDYTVLVDADGKPLLYEGE